MGFTDFVLRGSVEDRKFSLFYFRGEKLIAVDSINRPHDHMLARKLLANGAQPTPQQVSDPDFDLRVLANQPVPVAQGVA
jgi:3-phenylpropionate/trans-cinnamate dioxygenase ferredoxin reductase subunit